jgi:hypothetical protein
MKKVFAILLAVIYLVSVSGASLHFHYCMGKMQNWSIGYDNSKEDCPICGMTQKKGCCEDQHHSIQTDKQYSASSVLITISKITVDPLHHIDHYISVCNTDNFNIHSSKANAPPGRISNIPLFIENCNYRI